MITENLLKEYINTWHEAKILSPDIKSHLSEERIFELALPEAILTASVKEQEHLSTCAFCVSEWAFWAQIHTENPEDMSDHTPAYMSGGMLRAAASPGHREALKLQSACGRFLLGLLPEMDTPDQGMITLEAIGEARGIYNEKSVAVRDAKKRKILSGIIRNNRLARKCEAFQSIDLSTWTLIID